MLYEQLLEFDLTYEQLYDMTLKELIDTLINRRKGLGYKMWRLANLTGSAFSKKYPKTPEEASPELYPKPKTIKMPDFLVDEWASKMVGGR